LYENAYLSPRFIETAFASATGKTVEAMSPVPFETAKSRLPLHFQLASTHLGRLQTPVQSVSTKSETTPRAKLSGQQHSDSEVNESSHISKEVQQRYLPFRRKSQLIQRFLRPSPTNPNPPSFTGAGIWLPFQHNITATLGSVVLFQNEVRDKRAREDWAEGKTDFLPGGVNFSVSGKLDDTIGATKDSIVRFSFIPRPWGSAFKQTWLSATGFLLPELLLDFKEPAEGARSFSPSPYTTATSSSASPELVRVSAKFPRHVLDIGIPSSALDVRICSQHQVQGSLEMLQDDQSGVSALVTEISKQFHSPNLSELLHPSIAFPAQLPQLESHRGKLKWWQPENEERPREVAEIEAPVAYMLAGLERRRVIPFVSETTGDSLKYDYTSADGGQLRGRWSGYRVHYPSTAEDEADKTKLFTSGVEYLLEGANEAVEKRRTHLIHISDDE
jgi:hypothetical protein